MNEPIYITHWGVVYRFTPRRWQKFLRARASGSDPDPVEYGSHVAVITIDTVNLTPERATKELNQISQN
jgi:hypothetical protein